MIDRQTNIPTCVNWKSNWHTPIVHKVFCSFNVHILEQCIRKLIPAIPMYLSFMHDGVSRHCQILSSSSIATFNLPIFMPVLHVGEDDWPVICACSMYASYQEKAGALFSPIRQCVGETWPIKSKRSAIYTHEGEGYMHKTPEVTLIKQNINLDSWYDFFQAEH